MFAFVQRVDRLEQVIRSDLPEREPVFVAGFFDEVKKINIVFLILRQADVVMHGGIVKDEG